MTPDRQADIDAKNAEVVRADAERQAEAMRPTVARVQLLKAELVRLVPSDLAGAVRATAAEQARLHGVVSEATRALAAHLANEPTAEAELDDWLRLRAELEARIPFLRRFEQSANVAAGAALERARQSLAAPAAERKRAAADAVKSLQEEARRALEEEQLTYAVVNQAAALATTLTADDLAESQANDTSRKSKKG